ncbi:hypothetical protein AAFF_G00224830 [Aldrovandia affinis]|uniref:Uncharacterized protein n=1 Tax=Aldrovandia affinis TaxID=143900 RepID=A0AAD7TB28_9TELE|nr:hypothetical protein AAFF_G00224830 [Aldrovandia affinis]
MVNVVCYFFVSVSEGGAIVNLNTADYLISEDASSPDTKRIFESAEYAKDRATVFHSSVLSTFAKTQSVDSVSIGHYVLPPACVQQEVKAAVGRFIWEQEVSRGRGHFRGENMALEEGLLQPQDDYGIREDAKISQEESILSTPRREDLQCCNVQQYPVNNMVTGYVCIDQLRRYSGELHDFLPGHSGFLVSKAHNDKYNITSEKESSLWNTH